MNNLKSFLKERKSKRESGSTLVLYIMWMPLLIGVFGVGVDSAIGAYTQSTLQSSLDTATQSALSRAVNPGTNGNTTFKPKLTTEAARNYTISFYDTNRSGGENPFLQCQTSIMTPSEDAEITYRDFKFVSPPSGCGYTEGTFRMTTSGNKVELTTNVLETSSTVFLHAIGVPELKYNITSSARVTHEAESFYLG